MKVIVKVSGAEKTSLGIKDQEYEWTGDNAAELYGWATNFAEGYTQALMSGKNGITLYSPIVKQLDGYTWWSRHNTLRISVLNAKGKIVCKPEDIV